jgi:hypothetical protein
MERFPKFAGNAPLNPAFDRFRYCKFSKVEMRSGIVPLNVLKLKSRCFKDLSFVSERSNLPTEALRSIPA